MAGATGTRHIVLTGPPGVGKTTLIKKTCEAIQKAGIPAMGFYTEEVKEKGKRIGFDVVSLDGQRGALARISSPEPMYPPRREDRVGQYVVNTAAFEEVALRSLAHKDHQDIPVVVVDEVGKMELFSESFKEAVKELFSSDRTVFATIPTTRGRPIGLIEEIRNRQDIKLYSVATNNRDKLLDEITKDVYISATASVETEEDVE